MHHRLSTENYLDSFQFLTFLSETSVGVHEGFRGNSLCKCEGVVAESHSETEFGFLRNSQASSSTLQAFLCCRSLPALRGVGVLIHVCCLSLGFSFTSFCCGGGASFMLISCLCISGEVPALAHFKIGLLLSSFMITFFVNLNNSWLSNMPYLFIF